jgi:hypothetical protein
MQTASDKMNMHLTAQHKTDEHPNQKECHTIKTRWKVEMTLTATSTTHAGKGTAHKLQEHQHTG